MIIPFLDSERYLPAAVEGVFRQTLRDWELILVDGGSRDASRGYARELAERHPGCVRALRHSGSRPLGVFQSRVWGARHARAPLIALLDSDDEWDARILQRHEVAYRRAFDSRRGLVFCPAVYFWDGDRPARRLALQPIPRPGLHRPPELFPVFLESGYVKTPCGTSALMDRRILLESAAAGRGVGRHMIEDMYLWFYVAMRHPVYVSPRPMFWYRQHPESLTARGKARGEFQRLRRRHLRWLLAHVEDSASGPRRRRLAGWVRAGLAE